MIAIGHRTGIVSIHDMEQNTQFTLAGHAGGDELNLALERVVWTANDSKLLTVGRDYTARVWSLKTARFRFVRNMHEKKYSLVSIHPMNKQIVFDVSRKIGRAIEIFDFDGKLRRTFGGHTSLIRSVLFARDGSIVTHSNDRIQIWPTKGDPIVIPRSPGNLFAGSLHFDE